MEQPPRWDKPDEQRAPQEGERPQAGPPEEGPPQGGEERPGTGPPPPPPPPELPPPPPPPGMPGGGERPGAEGPGARPPLEVPPLAPSASPYGPRRLPEEGMSRAVSILLGVFVGAAAVTLVLFLVLSALQARGRAAAPPWKAGLVGGYVGLVRISGPIVSGPPSSSLFGPAVATSERIVKQLNEALKDDRCKAIVLRVDSPGGSAAASEEIYRAVRRVAKKKPVFVSMADVAASGAYYISAGATRIYANKATITGSIGVLGSYLLFPDAMEKLGIKMETFKSGKFKDTGNFSREMTDEERELIQREIDTIYKQFVAAVAEGRGMELEKVKKLADGRIFVGEEALKHKLVDAIGGLQETLDAAAKEAKLPADYHVRDFSAVSPLEELLGIATRAAASLGNVSDQVGDELSRLRQPGRNLLRLPGY